MKFKLGRLVITAGVLNSGIPHDHISKCVWRHVTGNWGDICVEDKRTNDEALELGNRIVSSYEGEHEKLWVITEHDRSVTTILLPEEY